MFRTRRANISPIWTHSCQRSNDLCLLSPVARLSGGFRRTGRSRQDKLEALERRRHSGNLLLLSSGCTALIVLGHYPPTML